jgi:DNA invertase Pin-like site-specific DNA recombinase
MKEQRTMIGMNGSNRAVLYARVSSKDQEREGFSIPAQLKLLRQCAREQHLTIVREFVDVETAKQSGRGGFGEMIAALKADPSCRTILVEKTDRLYRNIKDWMTVDDLDVTIHFVKENAIVSKDSRSSEKFLHGIKVLMAKNYVDNLSEEVKKGLLEKAEQGHWPTVAPVGYVNNRATHRIDVDPTRGSLVTAVFELYASGQHSLKSVARRAYELGLRHSRGNRRMTTSEIHRMLRNPIYTGDFRWLGKLYHGSHAPLISHATFAAVQGVLHRKPRARYPKQRHAFMGLLTCARCGCAMTAERKKGKYTYYRCTAFHGRCGNFYIREEQLAQLLGGVVDKFSASRAHCQGDHWPPPRQPGGARAGPWPIVGTPSGPPARAAGKDRPRIRRLRRAPDFRRAMGQEIGRMGNRARERDRRTQRARAAGDVVRRNG